MSQDDDITVPITYFDVRFKERGWSLSTYIKQNYTRTIPFRRRWRSIPGSGDHYQEIPMQTSLQWNCEQSGTFKQWSMDEDLSCVSTVDDPLKRCSCCVSWGRGGFSTSRSLAEATYSDNPIVPSNDDAAVFAEPPTTRTFCWARSFGLQQAINRRVVVQKVLDCLSWWITPC